MARLCRCNGAVLFIDATHNVSNKVGVVLVTCLVVGPGGKGNIVAWMLVKGENVDLYTVFFRLMKQTVDAIARADGVDDPCWRPTCLVSDLAESSSNGLENVFPTRTGDPEVVWVWCHWHVLKAWKSRLCGKLQNGQGMTREKRNKFRAQVLTLMHDLLNEMDMAAATNKHNNFRSFLQAHDADAFLQYYEAHHGGTADGMTRSDSKMRRWAMCHRNTTATLLPNGLQARTNMICESWHRILKHDHLEGKRNYKCGILLRLMDRQSRRQDATMRRDVHLLNASESREMLKSIFPEERPAVATAAVPQLRNGNVLATRSSDADMARTAGRIVAQCEWLSQAVLANPSNAEELNRLETTLKAARRSLEQVGCMPCTEERARNITPQPRDHANWVQNGDGTMTAMPVRRRNPKTTRQSSANGDMYVRQEDRDVLLAQAASSASQEQGDPSSADEPSASQTRRSKRQRTGNSAASAPR